MANKDRRTEDRMMGEDIMTKETEDRMCLLKRHNDKRTEGIMTKETRDRMCLLKRHNDIMNRRYNNKGNERQNVLIEKT